MGEADKVRETAANSLGSAMREQEKWAESLEGHLGRLKASWQELSQKSINSEFSKGLIDLITLVLDLTNKVGGLIPVLAVLGGVMAGLKVEALSVSLISLLKAMRVISIGNQGVALTFSTIVMSAQTLTAIITGGLVVGLIATVYVLDRFNVTLKEQQEILAKASEEYQKHADQVKEYQEKLQAIKDRLQELNQLKQSGQISQSQQEELSLLEKQNEELQRRLNIELELERIAKEKQDEEATKLLYKGNSTGYSVLDYQNSMPMATSQPEKLKSDIELYRSLQNQYQELIKQLDDDRQNLSDKEIQDRSRIIQNLEKQINEKRNSIALLSRDISDTVDKLSDNNPLKSEMNGLLDSVNELFANNNITAKASETSEAVDQVSRSVKSFAEQMDELSNQQKSMASYIDEYNEKGVLSLDTVNDILTKYPQYVDFLIRTADGYKLNIDAIDQFNKITETQQYLTDRYFDSLQKTTQATKDFAIESNKALSALSSSFFDEDQSLVSKLNPENIDTETISNMIDSLSATKIPVESIANGLNEIIDKIKETNQNFVDGIIDIQTYFKEFQSHIDSLDFENMNQNGVLQGLFTELTATLQDGIAHLNNEFESGKISIREYVDSLQQADQALLKLHVAQNDLHFDSDKQMYFNADGVIDEAAQIANSIDSVNQSLDGFDSYLNIINSNADYLRANLDALGNAMFTSADIGTSAYQSLASSVARSMDDIQNTSVDTYQSIMDTIIELSGMTAEELEISNGNFLNALLSNADLMNVTMNAMTSQLGQAMNHMKTHISGLISSLGAMISSFKYSIVIKPNIKVDFKNLRSPIYGQIDISGQGGYKDSSGNNTGIFDPSTQSKFAEQVVGSYVSGLNLGDILNKGFKKSTTPATPKPKKSGRGGQKGSGSDIERKDINTVDEYEQTIKRLDLAINTLTSSRDKLIEGSDEYNDSLHKELLLNKSKEKLTQEELKRIQEELKKYTDLDKVKEKLEKANQKGTKATKESNKAIDSYNKRLKEKTDLENKAIQLQNTIINLQKKQEDILRKQADIIANSSNKKISKLELEISLIESRQKLVSEDSKDYFDFQADKIDLLIKKQQQLRADITATQALLAMASKLGYSGDQIEKWQDDVINAKKQILDTEYEIREAGKQQRISDVKNVIDDVSSYVETLNNVMSNFDMKLSLLDSDDYVNKVDTLGKAMGFAVTKVSSLQNAMSRLQSVQPQTKEEAQELADQMSNVAKQVLEARKAAFEYKKQMDILVVDQLSSKYHAEFEKLNTLMTAFSHNIEMLEGGLLDGTDIDFGIGVLPDIPQSVYDKESAELDKMIAEYEVYEAEIQKIRQMSFEEQEKMQKKFDEEMLNEKGEIDEETKKRTSDTYDMIIRTIAEAMGLNLDNISDGHKHQLDVIKSALFETKDIYKMTWAEIVNIVSASLSAVQNATTQGLHSYTNFDANGKFLGITYGKSGQSNFMKDAAYIGAENGKYYNTDGTGERKNIPQHLKKKVPKYASGTDGHRGGVALISEYDREEMVLFPDGSTKVFKNATLIDLPEGSQVLNPEETKDVKRYIGNKFDNGKIPKYAKGTGKKRRVKKSMDEEAAEWNSNVTDTVIIDNRKIDIKNVDYSKNYQSWNQSEKAQQDRNEYDKSKITNKWHHTNTGTPFGEPIGYDLLKSGIRPSGFSATGQPLYNRNDGGAFAYTDKYGFTHTTTSYTDALTFSRDGVIKNWSGKHYGGYAYDDDGSRLHLADMPNSNMFGNFSKDGYYNDIAYDENGNPYTVRKYGGKDAVYSGKLSNVNLQNLSDIIAGKYIDNIKNNDFTSALNQHLQSSSTGMYGSAYGSYSSDGKYNYYNREDKTEHEKRIDKARYDVFLSQAIASEFKQYKQARETAMATIKAEQEAIKKHFADGGIRDTVEDQIQSLLDKIDIQTSKDVDMNFRLTEDILKQQKEQTESYMKETQQKYLNGISSGLSTEALRKLRDEYNDAQKEHMNIEKALKDNTRARFEYEFAMMDKKTQRIKDHQDLVRMDIEYTKFIHPEDIKTIETYYDKLKKYEEEFQKQLQQDIKILHEKQNMFSAGSYEWNLYEEQLKKTNKELKDTEKTLHSIIKDKYDSAFSAVDHKVKGIQTDKNLINLNIEYSKLKDPNDNSKIDAYYHQLREEENKVIAIYQEQIQILEEKQKTLEKGSYEFDLNNKQLKENKILLLESQIALEKIGQSIQDNRIQNAKSVENMIISMIRKRVEKEKEMLQRSLHNYEKIANEKIKIISKTQDDKQFNRWLKNEKDGIQEIQDQLNKLALDDSLEAKYQFVELSKALKERKENLDIALENKSNDDRIKNIQDLVDRERERTRILMSNLDRQLDAENIYAEARKALQDKTLKYMIKSTEFNNGEIINSYKTMFMSLDEAAILFMNEFGEGMSLSGEKIKTEFINNLNLVIEKFHELESIMLRHQKTFALDQNKMWKESEKHGEYERSLQIVDTARRFMPNNSDIQKSFNNGLIDNNDFYMNQKYRQERDNDAYYPRRFSSNNNNINNNNDYKLSININNMNGTKKEADNLGKTLVNNIQRMGGRV